MRTGTKKELKLVLGWLLIGVVVPAIIPPALAPPNQSSPTAVGLALLLSGGLAATASAYTYRRSCALWQTRLRDLIRSQNPLGPSLFRCRFLAGVGTVLTFGLVGVVVGLLLLASAVDQL